MMARSFCLLLLAALACACRYDPVEQQIIDSLGPEKGTPNAEHRPGQPCLVCHDKYGGAQPQMAVGGTVFALDDTMKNILPAANMRIQVLDSNNATPKRACSNKAGNFWVTADNWGDITFPLSPSAGGVAMQSLIGRDGSCASCHKLPDADSLDPVTGAGRESAGVILVDATKADPTCMTGGGQ